MYDVMTNGSKGERLHLRIRPDVKDDLRVTAELHGLNVSAFINHLIVMAIRKEKDERPDAFKTPESGTPHTQERDMIAVKERVITRKASRKRILR